MSNDYDVSSTAASRSFSDKRKNVMEFLVEFEVNVPDGTADSEVKDRESAEASRTSTQIETAARDLDRLNNGVFISVAGRPPAGVVYETYLVA